MYQLISRFFVLFFAASLLSSSVHAQSQIDVALEKATISLKILAETEATDRRRPAIYAMTVLAAVGGSLFFGNFSWPGLNEDQSQPLQVLGIIGTIVVSIISAVTIPSKIKNHENNINFRISKIIRLEALLNTLDKNLLRVGSLALEKGANPEKVDKFNEAAKELASLIKYKLNSAKETLRYYDHNLGAGARLKRLDINISKTISLAEKTQRKLNGCSGIVGLFAFIKTESGFSNPASN
jgi:hypothetical protein